MPLTIDEVRKVARLARVELTDEELERQATHLNDLLAQFDVLSRLDLDGIEPTSHSIPMHNVLREDVIEPSLPRDEVLMNAPEFRDGCFIVPRILQG